VKYQKTSLPKGPSPKSVLTCELTPELTQVGPAKLSIEVVERNPELATRLTVRGVNIRVKV